MFKKISKRKAQSTAEYAIMLGLVIAAIVAMQRYAQRALQAKIFDATRYLAVSGGNVLRSDGQVTAQYEPTYLDSDYTIGTTSTQIDRQIAGQTSGGISSFSNSTTGRTGGQTALYSGAENIDI